MLNIISCNSCYLALMQSGVYRELLNLCSWTVQHWRGWRWRRWWR